VGSSVFWTPLRNLSPKITQGFLFCCVPVPPPSFARPPRPLPPPVEPPFLCLRYLWGFLCLRISPAFAHPYLTVGYLLIFFPSCKALLDQWRFAELYLHRVVLFWYFYTFPILLFTPKGGGLRASHPTHGCLRKRGDPPPAIQCSNP